MICLGERVSQGLRLDVIYESVDGRWQPERVRWYYVSHVIDHSNCKHNTDRLGYTHFHTDPTQIIVSVNFPYRCSHDT